MNKHKGENIAVDSGQGRQEIDFNKGWLFQRLSDDPSMKEPAYKDNKWETVTLPHDWAIDGHLNKKGHLKNEKPFFDAPVIKVLEGRWLFEKGDASERKEPGFDDSKWQEVKLPASWEEHSGYMEDNAWGWYRREIVIPAEHRGKDVILDLGCIDDLDETYFNGTLIGKTGFLHPYFYSAWNTKRYYRVPAALINYGGPDTMAVRVFDSHGEGGMRSAEPVETRDGPFDMAADGGSANGFLPGGTGWYRKKFSVHEDLRSKKISIEFDGAYMDAEVWLNGVNLGSQPYGYTSFSFDLTPHLKYGKEKNTLAVRLNVLQQCTRWYSGAGIYRDVRLVVKEPVSIAKCGVFVKAKNISKDKADLLIDTEMANETDKEINAAVETVIYDGQGTERGSVLSPVILRPGGKETIKHTIALKNPVFWNTENPMVYSALSRLIADGRETDKTTTPFGIRTIEFTKDKGFFLNGVHTPIKGVCLHHDNGYLGAAFHERAAERQIEILKSMGCNAIRTSHNPPDPKLLDLCDRMGMLVMDEAFDEWKENKVTHGYGRFYDEWAEKDLTAMLLRDRNHPCVIMWSIGNEVAEQWAGSPKDAEKRAKFLADITRRLDPARPVTAACNNVDDALNKGISKHLDVFGINYSDWAYKREKGKHKLLGAETASCVSSRGVYNLTEKEGKVVIEHLKDTQVSSYDDYAPQWAIPAWKSLKAVEEAPWMAGEFVWTGFDYIGEPTPYWWPAVVSYFGIIDLCGFPKDRYYLYKSRWTKEPMVHLLPHWNWPQFAGKEIPVYVYTNCESAELFLNGKSLGEKKMKDAEKLRLEWSVAYEPGELKAVGKNSGMQAAVDTRVTADKADRIQISADRDRIKSDGKDLSYITVQVLDKDGNVCPTADNWVEFSVSGAGSLAATGNGNSINHAFFKAKKCKAFSGMVLGIVKAGEKQGKIKVEVKGKGLKAGRLILDVL